MQELEDKTVSEPTSRRSFTLRERWLVLVCSCNFIENVAEGEEGRPVILT